MTETAAIRTTSFVGERLTNARWMTRYTAITVRAIADRS